MIKKFDEKVRDIPDGIIERIIEVDEDTYRGAICKCLKEIRGSEVVISPKVFHFNVADMGTIAYRNEMVIMYGNKPAKVGQIKIFDGNWLVNFKEYKFEQ